MLSSRIHSIHHVNFPTTDSDRTKEWYGKVFGLRAIPTSALNNTKVLLLTYGDFDLHFTPVDKSEWRRMAPSHFAIEVEDWSGFLDHLHTLGVRHTKPVERVINQSKFCYIHDPDGTMIEIVYHDSLHTSPAA